MTIIICVLTAWLSVIFVVLLAIIYLLRIVNKGKRKSKFITKINRKLRNSHKIMGIAFVITAAIHGFFSSCKIWSLNFGTLCMVIGVVIGLTYMLRKIFPRKLTWIKPHRWLTAVLIVVLGLHIWEVGGIMGPEVFLNSALREVENSVDALYGSGSKVEAAEITADATSSANTDTRSTTETAVPDSVTEKANLFLGTVDLMDGTYTGVADGYGPDLTVKVTVAGNVISTVQVVSHHEDGVSHYGRAIDAIPAAIVAQQTPVVDSISGATYTSDGIMKAVINALKPAVISGTLPSL